MSRSSVQEQFADEAQPQSETTANKIDYDRIRRSITMSSSSLPTTSFSSETLDGSSTAVVPVVPVAMSTLKSLPPAQPQPTTNTSGQSAIETPNSMVALHPDSASAPMRAIQNQNQSLDNKGSFVLPVRTTDTTLLPTVKKKVSSSRGSDDGNDRAIIAAKSRSSTASTSLSLPVAAYHPQQPPQLKPQSQTRSQSRSLSRSLTKPRPRPESLSRSRPQSQLAGATVGAGFIGATTLQQHRPAPQQQQQQVSAQLPMKHQVQQPKEIIQRSSLRGSESKQLQQNQIKELYLELEEREEKLARLQKIHDLKQEVQHQQLTNSVVQNSYRVRSSDNGQSFGGDTSVVRSGLTGVDTSQGGVGARLSFSTGTSSGEGGDYANRYVIDNHENRTTIGDDSIVGRFEKEQVVVDSHGGNTSSIDADAESGLLSAVATEATSNNQTKHDGQDTYMVNSGLLLSDGTDASSNQSTPGQGKYIADSGSFLEVTDAASSLTENTATEELNQPQDRGVVPSSGINEVEPELINSKIGDNQPSNDFRLSLFPVAPGQSLEGNTPSISYQEPLEKIPFLRFSEAVQKWGVLLLISVSLAVLTMTIFLSEMISDGINGGGGAPTMAPTVAPNDAGMQYNLAFDIIEARSISTLANLPRGCINTLCDGINTPSNITIYHKALDQCVFVDRLLGARLRKQVIGVGPDINPIVVVQCYVTSLLGFSLGVTKWTNNDGWIDPKDNECTWKGITCNDEKEITIIELPNNNMNGTLPGRELFRLEKLEELKLYSNTIYGDISEVGECKTLRQLWLSATKHLSGTIPTSIGLLSNMVSIYLSENKLEGSIPSEIGRLKSLVNFSVYKNLMVGSIPSAMFELASLKRIFLYHNELIGSIPDPSRLEALTDFRTEHNKLDGAIPEQFAVLIKLERLSLDHNELTGNIPANWISNNNLANFTAGNNKLTGEIPEDLFKLGSKLTSLSLSMNDLDEKKIPDNICENFTVLNNLDLSYNKYTGTIPDSIEKCARLETLKLSNNKLSGKIPPWIKELRNLETLYLDNNSFTGVIPEDFGLTPNLTFVKLENNKINGKINESLCNHVKKITADCPDMVKILCCTPPNP